MFGPLIVLALASIVFLSVIIVVVALMLRGQWEKMGEQRQNPPE
ncbi:MAG TPA: hypothetical protein VHI51_01820 [Ktedonobacterales bacterium]|nr:hypothetical protein [Ktedonobacterales bacterium]